MNTKITFILLLFISINTNSQNWISGGISANSNQGGLYDMEFHNNILFASVNNDGLIQSTDNATTWSTVNQTDFILNANDRHISRIISTSSSLYIVTFYAFSSSSMIWKSTDNGATFTKDIEGFPVASNDNTRLMNIGDIFYENGHLIAVINGGNYTKKEEDSAWKPIDESVKFAEYYDSHNNTLYAFPSYGIYTSTDDGDTWTKTSNSNLPQLFLANNLDVNPITGRIYVSGKGLAEQVHKLLYSDDEGETWVNANVESYLGTSWIGIPQTITEIYSYGNRVQLSLENNNTTSGPEIIVSTDNSATFSDDKIGIVDSGVGTTQIIKFLKDSDNLYAAVNFGQIYKKDVLTLSTSSFLKKDIITIYPNPTNDVLLISTEKNQAFYIYDINGKKVKSGKISKTNNSIITKNLQKGNYLLKLKADHQTKTYKFLKN